MKKKKITQVFERAHSSYLAKLIYMVMTKTYNIII